MPRSLGIAVLQVSTPEESDAEQFAKKACQSQGWFCLGGMSRRHRRDWRTPRPHCLVRAPSPERMLPAR